MKKLFMTIILIIVLSYGLYVYISQEKLLKNYNSEITEYKEKIESAQIKKNELEKTMQDLNSVNLIEETAREKLDMYLPDEKVFIDAEK